MLTRALRYTSRRLKTNNYGMVTSLPMNKEENERNLIFREFHASTRQVGVKRLDFQNITRLQFMSLNHTYT